MKLSIMERIILMNLLPKEGDFITLKLVRKIRESLSFSEAEIKAVDFRTHWVCPKCKAVDLASTASKCDACGIYMVSKGQVTWDDSKNVPLKDVHMGGTIFSLCSSLLRKLSDEKKLAEEHMSLYEKFVEDEEKEE